MAFRIWGGQSRRRVVICTNIGPDRMGFPLRLLGLWLVCLITLFSAPAQAQSGACNGGQAIRMADLSWESATFTTHVINTLLGAGYGCTVEIVPGTSAAVESALVQDDLQIIAEMWSGRSAIIE